MLDGTMCVMKSTNVSALPCVDVRADVALRERRDASSPAPGFIRFTTIRPIASANVVTISK